MPPPTQPPVHPLPLFPTPPAKRLGRTSHNYRKVSRETKEKTGGKKMGGEKRKTSGNGKEIGEDRGKEKHSWPVFLPRCCGEEEEKNGEEGWKPKERKK